MYNNLIYIIHSKSKERVSLTVQYCNLDDICRVTSVNTFHHNSGFMYGEVLLLMYLHVVHLETLLDCRFHSWVAILSYEPAWILSLSAWTIHTSGITFQNWWVTAWSYTFPLLTHTVEAACVFLGFILKHPATRRHRTVQDITLKQHANRHINMNSLWHH